MCDLAIAFKSTRSESRLRNAGFTSTVSNPPSGGFPFGIAPPPFATIAASICFVTSGSAGAPSCVENLMPLYSGGLCDAVKLIAPDVFNVRTACAIAGVGAASGIKMGVMPAPASTLAASVTKLSPRKRGSRPTSTLCGSGCVFTYAAIPATASRMFATVNSSATIALHPEVPNLIAELIVFLQICLPLQTARPILQHRGEVGKPKVFCSQNEVQHSRSFVFDSQRQPRLI